MSLFDCIQRAVEAGEMDIGRGGEAQAVFRELSHRLGHLGAEASEAEAARLTKQIMAERAARRKRLALKQAATAKRLWENLRDYRNLRGEASAADGLVALLEWDQAGKFDSVSRTQQALQIDYMRQINGLLEKHGRGVLGQVRKKAELPNLVRELFRQGTGDASARELAQAVLEVFERARLDFNAAGGNIGKLDDFAIPQNHDPDAIGAVPFEEWRVFVSDRLDWSRIRDFETELPFEMGSSERKRMFLRAIYDDIRSDGVSKMEPSFQVQGRALANRRADHRVLHFNGPDAWMEYNERFGRADPFSTIVNHVEAMARDTALMRVLGPNPKAGLEFAIQVAKKLAHERPWRLTGESRIYSSPAAEVDGKGNLARNMLAQITGEANQPFGDRMALMMAGFRNFLTSAKLGFAQISATSDISFVYNASRHLGMDAGRVLTRAARQLASAGEREAAGRRGFYAEHMADTGVQQARWGLDVHGPAITERMAEMTMRLSGLTYWTSEMRRAFQIELTDMIFSHFGQRWDDLPALLRFNFFEQHGFSAADWDKIRATPLTQNAAGMSIFHPLDIRYRSDLDQEEATTLALRLMGAIREQDNFAVPTASIRGRATILGSTRGGTVSGEIMRSALMFKSFPLTLYFQHIRRLALAPALGGWPAKTVNAAVFAASTIMLGAFATQMKEVAKGRDPRDMSAKEFWAQAIFQGGGLGIFGDFISSSTNRFGGSPGQTLAGPAITTASDWAVFAGSTVSDLMKGDDPRTGRRLAAGMRQNTPVASVWWMNLAFQRLVVDTIQQTLDPEAEKAWRRAERRRVKDYGNPAWWRAGELSPARAPDLSRAIGGDEP